MALRTCLGCIVLMHLTSGGAGHAAPEGAHNSTRALAPFADLGGMQCPPCGDLFSKAKTGADGKKNQHVEIQLRGEPKSGTTMMYSWAVGTLARTCEHLQATFGRASCRVDPDLTKALALTATLIFEPALVSGGDYSACPCDSVNMVNISVTTARKHRLPVDGSCRWSHPIGIVHGVSACRKAGGAAVTSYADLWACMQEASCKVSDDKLQFAPLRDPRAVAVSSFFHMRRNRGSDARDEQELPTVDEVTLESLPIVSQWVALRHILFDGLMANSSATFWYEDAQEDPLAWHFRWTEFAGLRLPTSWVEHISSLRLEGPWVEKTLGVNPHPGGTEVSEARTWKDEVSPEIVDEMNSIVRTWLPPVLLARLGVPP
ncbi:unnamed protein product [Scytosiphon promiscuus]